MMVSFVVFVSHYCRERYWKPSFFAALEVVKGACEAAGVTMAGASLRWALHHSLLSGDAGDGIIIGASSPEQLATNLAVSSLFRSFKSLWLCLCPAGSVCKC